MSPAKRTYPWGASPPSPDRANIDGYRGGLLDVSDLPAGDSAAGCRQMLGQVWEWTATAFYPFPGFLPDFPCALPSNRTRGGPRTVAPLPACCARLLAPKFNSFPCRTQTVRTRRRGLATAKWSRVAAGRPLRSSPAAGTGTRSGRTWTPSSPAFARRGIRERKHCSTASLSTVASMMLEEEPFEQSGYSCTVEM
jgi:hypothetical protein